MSPSLSQMFNTDVHLKGCNPRKHGGIHAFWGWNPRKHTMIEGFHGSLLIATLKIMVGCMHLGVEPAKRYMF
jgi:hypothetical protein